MRSNRNTTVKPRSVPLGGKVRQLLTLGKFWKNSVNDLLVLPADQDDARQSLNFVNQRDFVVDTIGGDRAETEAVA